MTSCESHKGCMEDAMQRADEVCRDKGVRFTDLRRKVLNMVWENHGPAKAYDILGKLKGKDAAAKPPTVYRALDFLQENGLVHKLNSLNAYVGCSHPLKHKDCYFLICSSCQKIQECCSAAMATAIAAVTRKNHFQPGHITLEIEGLCEECEGQG